MQMSIHAAYIFIVQDEEVIVLLSPDFIVSTNKVKANRSHPSMS